MAPAHRQGAQDQASVCPRCPTIAFENGMAQGRKCFTLWSTRLGAASSRSVIVRGSLRLGGFQRKYVARSYFRSCACCVG